MRHADRLELDVRVEPDPVQDIGGEVLIGVVPKPALQVGQIEVRFEGRVEVADDAALRAAIPNAVSRPGGHLRLADGDSLTVLTAHVGRGHPCGKLVANAGEIR